MEWNIIDYIFKTFSEKELEVYKMRRIQNRTFEEIGKKLNVTRERIRQIDAKTENKMMHLPIKIKIEIELMK